MARVVLKSSEENIVFKMIVSLVISTKYLTKEK